MADSRTFHLIVTSVSGAQYDGEASSVTVPGSAGEMTLLAGHEPLVTTLKPGVITIRATGDTKERFEIQGGVIECVGNLVTVLL